MQLGESSTLHPEWLTSSAFSNPGGWRQPRQIMRDHGMLWTGGTGRVDRGFQRRADWKLRLRSFATDHELGVPFVTCHLMARHRRDWLPAVYPADILSTEEIWRECGLGYARKSLGVSLQ